jgi:hypothetical protein
VGFTDELEVGKIVYRQLTYGLTMQVNKKKYFPK